MKKYIKPAIYYHQLTSHPIMDFNASGDWENENTGQTVIHNPTDPEEGSGDDGVGTDDVLSKSSWGDCW